MRRWSRNRAPSFWLMVLLCSGALLLGVGSSNILAESALEREGRIKAALLYYIAKHVRRDYPRGSRMATGDSEFFICTIGEDILTTYLSETIEGKVLEGRALRANIVNGELSEEPLDLDMCQVLYIGSIGFGTVKKLREHLGVDSHFGLGGSMIVVSGTGMNLSPEFEIFKQDNRMRIRSYIQRLERKGYSLSPTLENLSEVVR